MKIYITGCAKSGTTLLQRLFYSFRDIKVIDREIKLFDFCTRKEQKTVGKRKFNTIFSMDIGKNFSIENLNQHVEKIKEENIKILNIIRDGRDVILSDNNWVPPNRWIECMQQRVAHSDLISLEIKYEELIIIPDRVQLKIADLFDLIPVHNFSNYPDFVPERSLRSISESIKQYNTDPKIYGARRLDKTSLHKDLTAYKKICSPDELAPFEFELKRANYIEMVDSE